jgi:general secretion pathway protein C
MGRGGANPDAEIVAVVDGTPITQGELDAALGPQLRDLERSRYRLRLAHLQHLIAQRVLGHERSERQGENAYAAALAEATVEVRLAPPYAGMQDSEPADEPEPIADGGGEATAKRSALPVTLVGTIVRDDPAKSMAALRLPGALLARNVQPGQTIIDDAVLLRVERNRILVRHKGALEFVPLSVNSEPSTPTPARTLAHFTRPPDRVLSLRRGDVDRALRDLAALEQSLTRADPEIDGRRLLVLSSVEAGSLYDLLQLQERDVLMQVNGEWVDDRRNPLWDALRSHGTVTLLVMRAGQPQSFAYEIY